METIGPSPLADLFPDEYLLDGGDRDTRAAHHTAGLSGLDTEDTIAEFTDHTGTLKMRASNRVAVYAPRFGTVRTVTGLAEDISINGAAGVGDALAANNLLTGNAPQESVQGSGPSELEGRNRVDGMIGSQPPVQSVRADGALQNNKFETGHQGRAIVELQSFHQGLGPELQQQVLNAVSWTRDDYPVITASTSGASELRATFKPEQYVGLEDEREPGTLCLIKLADRDTAQQGDVITFTIKFRNTGDLDVTDVRIIDNLTPRLEYVQGSARIDGDHPGGVDVQPNGEGSSILTFTLDGPLTGRDEGEITFEARVR
jgi:uncharacterized repeat protein (TIGR01451 family)